MCKVISPFCWHQIFPPRGLSASALGLYTCIISWKKLYKIRRLRHFFFKICNNWVKWQDISVDIKTLSPGGCLGAIYMYKIMKKLYKIRLQRDVLKLATNDRSDKMFLLTSKFRPQGVVNPALGLFTCKIMKKKIRLQRDVFETCSKWPKWQDVPIDIKISSPRSCHPLPWGYLHVKSWKKKSDFKEIFLKLVANDRRDKRFLLTSKFCPLGLSAPDLWLYTFIKSWNDVYKVRDWIDSF